MPSLSCTHAIKRANMNIKINRERLATSFTELCEISSPSRKEAEVLTYLKEKFTELGAESIYEDNSATKTGSNCGNLIIRFSGSLAEKEELFFSCHMDTVEPADNVEVVRTGDIFTSKGDTILGGDDKSGIAAIIEMITCLQENKTPHASFDVILTTCEEIGLLGAKHLETDMIQAKYGYALDSTGINNVIIGAPTANKIEITVKGLAAHAGLAPESGINAITLAAKALSKIRVGRLDDESTSNFGIISGGVASNIVADLVTIQGEVRSHSPEKAQKYTQEITDVFSAEVANWVKQEATGEALPSVECVITDDYPALSLDIGSPVIKRIKEASAKCGKELNYIVAGGGSDANILNGHGFPTAIVASGMEKVHTLDEELDLNNLVEATELVFSLVTE